MSGSHFLETLRQLGYHRTEELDSLAFDWLFEIEEAVPFLTWFCNSLGPNNVIPSQDIERFEILTKSGDVILEGHHLKEALKTIALTQQDTVTEEELRDQIEELREDRDSYKKRKQVMVCNRNKLNVHLATLRHKSSKLVLIDTRIKQKLQKVVEKCHVDNGLMMQSLEDLKTSVSQIKTLYEAPVKDEKQESGLLFLSQLSLDSYFLAEDTFSKEITAFTKKQFFQGIAEMAGQGEGSRYEILEVSSPESLLVRGEREEVVLEDCKELARLKEGYPYSEAERINALVSEKQVKTALQKIEDISRRIQNGDFPLDAAKMRQDLLENERSLTAVKRDIKSVMDVKLTPLLHKAGNFQSTRILTGDFNLKLVRQDYFTSNQDQVISQLIGQRTRNEFLTMAYEVEARSHREIQRLMAALSLHLQKLSSGWQARMQTMNNSAFSLARYQRSTIDTRNKSTTRLHQLLGHSADEDEQRLFLSYSSLLNGAQQLRQRHLAAVATYQATAAVYGDRLTQMEREIKLCEDAVYASTTTAGSMPEMSPRLIQEALAELDSLVQKAEASAAEVINDMNKKKQLLQEDPFLSKERELYTYFFNAPDLLRKEMDGLTARIEAHRVK